MTGTKDYAVIRDGGKQYIVSEGDTVYLENRKDPLPKEIELGDILAVRKGKQFRAGKKVAGMVKAEIDGRAKGGKSTAYMFKRRKGSHTKKGHRQTYLKVTIKEIKVGK